MKICICINIQGTRDVFIAQVCELIFDTQDDLLAAINGPTGRFVTRIHSFATHACVTPHDCIHMSYDMTR